MTNEYWQRMTVALTYLAQKRGKNTAHRFSQSLYANFIPTYSASTVDRSTWGNIEGTPCNGTVPVCSMFGAQPLSQKPPLFFQD